jgi:N-acetyl-1-D-myo-inositol-2-amino-2-deoxy-alpha-D-glucopyranoside deacetylase
MNKQKTLMFVGAHPDDETFGMGAVLAKYADSGNKVYFLCSTRGEAGTVDPGFLKGYNSIGDLRWEELARAAKVLGLSGFYHLGYRDSGMSGSKDNKNPAAMVNAPVEEAAGRIVKYFRQIKPDIVITHDPTGGYGHPDHIATYNATIRAIKLSGDSTQYPEAGPAFQPKKLYCGIRPHRFMKVMVRLMPLFGQDPHHFGRNKDIDITRMLNHEYPINASVRLKKKYLKIREKAAACHASQRGGGPRGRGFMGFIDRMFRLSDVIFGHRDYFMRLYPEVKSRRIESDLFQGI